VGGPRVDRTGVRALHAQVRLCAVDPVDRTGVRALHAQVRLRGSQRE
jgi:hypothetical protein